MLKCSPFSWVSCLCLFCFYAILCAYKPSRILYLSRVVVKVLSPHLNPCGALSVEPLSLQCGALVVVPKCSMFCVCCRALQVSVCTASLATLWVCHLSSVHFHLFSMPSGTSHFLVMWCPYKLHQSCDGGVVVPIQNCSVGCCIDV